MKLDGIRHKVFMDRYSLKDEEGNPTELTPNDMWKRVARGIAENEKKADRKKWEKEFYRVMDDFKFVPAGRILSGAGTGYQVTYFNCFVIPSPKDSRHGILEALGQLVEIQARSGGVGLNMSSLRPKGARVKKVNGTSSGPVNWATLFSVATHDIVQQGGSRRGATMLMLWDWHPDIEEFITVKEDLTKINGANLSVCVSDAFMEAVKADADWDLVYPDLTDPKYDTKWDGEIDKWRKLGGKVIVHKTIKAQYLWDLICTAAWKSAEPGLHFLERSNKRSNTWYFERLVATNPCGEQPLGPWAVCNLGAMNLVAYVKNGEFDFDSFSKDTRTAMRLLDNVIDLTYYFFKENEKSSKDIRRTGLGIMGLGDALIKMKLRYGAEESFPVIEKIFKTLRDSAYDASADLAKEKGAFPMFDKKKYLKGYHIQALPKKLQDKIAKQGIRNAVLLTIAPTGTTGLVAGVTSGIEPVYEFSFKRKWRGGEETMYHPLFDEWRLANPDAEKPAYFASANDLTPLEHAKVQAIAQAYIDSSISKTVNAPNAHTIDDVKNLYMAAYDLGLKGVTYMRDGSRQGVLERIVEKPVEKPVEQAPVIPVTPRMPRPMMLQGLTYKSDSPSGKLYVTLNHDEKENLFEVFINHGKSGSDLMALADALGRMISFVLRIHSPVPTRERVREIISELAGIGGSRSIGFGENKVRSLPDAISKILAKHYNFRVNGKVEDRETLATIRKEFAAAETASNAVVANGTTVNVQIGIQADGPKLDEEPVVVSQLALTDTTAQAMSTSSTSLFDICPECGSSSLAYEDGCQKCYACGYSAC
ncbi:MAG TPA: adenosylcobalamin-dependent ribonucleoside-diphosphate reductase [Candidatus Limnocylindrales bacterium]|nr:adenosylcobalamin-dependent ribonucleoside-diphosphate reductase [Candidatus Limnocylindrales bacterium]